MTKRPWLLCALVVLLPTVGYAQPCTGARPNDICEKGPARSETEAAAPATVPSKPNGPSAKVSGPIRAVLSSMQRQILGAEGQSFVALYSTDLVRVNPAGEIQVYVELVEFRPEYVVQLAGHGLRIQASLPQFRLIQGWLPAGAVDTVAALDFVKEVRPPDYPVRNSVDGASTEGDSILRAWVAHAELQKDHRRQM